MFMENYVEIHIDGMVGSHKLTPKNFDIAELQNILGYAGGLLYPTSGKSRPTISLEIKDGSVRNIFHTSKQAVVQFAAMTALVSSTGSLSGLDLETAKSIDGIQKMSIQKGYSIDFRPSTTDKPTLSITPTTKLLIEKETWADGEFYFYGKITTAGGKQGASIKIDTEEHGLLTISTSKDFLSEIKENLLYHNCGIRATGRQNVNTDEIDKASLELEEIIDYSPSFDEDYMKSLVKKGTESWKGINSEQYLNKLRRGGFYA